ncbi:hypothetical protein ACFL1S_00100 [Pseudomonadota bacterium]
MPSPFKVQPENILGPILVVFLVFVVFSIYAPGRYGGFLLDDYVNIGPMSQVEQGFDGLVRYIFSGAYGSPDRWLSKLSFLLDSPSWPSDAYRFKQNNILLHILNGLLVIWVFLCLMRNMGHTERVSQFVALTLGALWLLHPLNTSTALYVVQRMTELSGLFVLTGTLLYLKGRKHLANNPVWGYLLMSLGLMTGTVLGYLSKENAALLPMFMLAVELTLLKRLPAPRNFRIWIFMFLYLPSAMLVAWLVYQLPGYMLMDQYRPFNLWERLMTEARVLMDYLRVILLPTRIGTGVYHDDFTISRGLLDPPTTLLSIAAIAGLLLSAFRFRSTLPVLTFGITWFFVGHILESTVVPLELYFEHRNYIPMLGPLFAVCYYLITIETRLGMLLKGSLMVFTALAAVSTWQNVYVWTDVSTNLEKWEKEHPSSPRVLQYATNLYGKMEKYDEAEIRLHKLSALRPEWAAPKLELITLSCQSGKNRMLYTIDELVNDLAHSEYETVTVRVIDTLFRGMQKKPCEFFSMSDIGRMVEQLINNANYQNHNGEMGNLYALRGRYNGYLGNHRQQALDFNESYRLKQNHYIAIAESEVWAALGEYDRALEAITKAKGNYHIALQNFRYKFESEEIDKWEKFIVKTIKEKQGEQM